MFKNGQLPYIASQEWFKDGSVEVDVDVNFYKDRPYSLQFGFHKDTAGDNLFVNLIFNNEEPTPATEWTEDLTRTDVKKAEIMDRVMGTKVRPIIESSRQSIIDQRVKLLAPETIRGGVAGKLAFVSWVDELVWHSTPAITSRNYYDRLKNQLQLWYVDVEPLWALAKINGTLVQEEWLYWQPKGYSFDKQFVGELLDDFKQNSSKRERHEREIELNRDTLLVAHTSAGVLDKGEEIAQDLDKCGLGVSSHQRDMGIKQRIRANSNAKKAQELAEARARNPTRSFIRTWVRLRKVEK
jgi:hypothetical protein